MNVGAKDRKPRACVFGAGEYYRKLLGGLEEQFQVVQVVDKECEEPFQLVEPLAPACIFILSPNATHYPILKSVAPLNVPILIEKPAVISKEELEALKTILRRNPRIYFSDFYLDVRAAPLLALTKSLPSYLCWLNELIRPCGNQRVFVEGGVDAIGEIRKVHGSILEGKGSAATMEHRAWLRNPVGGGVFLDLMCHLLSVTGRLFPKLLFQIEGVEAGCWREGMPYGQWEPIDSLQHHTETYAHIWGTMGGHIPFSFKVGKYWQGDDRNLILTGTNGELRMEFTKVNTLYWERPTGETARIRLDADYYHLVPEAFRSYIDSGSQEPHNYLENRTALEAIFFCKSQYSALVRTKA